MSSQCKQGVYLPEDVFAEVDREARRQDRSKSWLVQRAWRIAKAEIRSYPASTDFEESDGSEHPGEAP